MANPAHDHRHEQRTEERGRRGLLWLLLAVAVIGGVVVAVLLAV